MAFLVFADIFAVYIFPCLLAVAHLPLIMAYMLIRGSSPEHMYNGDEALCLLAISVITITLVYEFGLQTAHLRTTASDLGRYMGQFFRLVIMADLVGIAFHAVITAVIPFRDFRSFFPVAADLPLLLSILLGAVVLMNLASRTFLTFPFSQTEPELVRGQDLEDEDEIARRAWFDD